MQVLVLDGEGRALSVTKGLVTASEIQQSLKRGVAAFSKQVYTAQYMLTSSTAQAGPLNSSHVMQVGQSNTAEQPTAAGGNTTGNAY